MTKEKLIIDNRSSKPLYKSYEKAFDFYFQEYDETWTDIAATYGDFKFYLRRNKSSVTIQIYDL